MVEGGFLKGKNGLTLAEHGLVLKQSDRDVVIDKVLPNCKGDFESGDTILVRLHFLLTSSLDGFGQRAVFLLAMGGERGLTRGAH